MARILCAHDGTGINADRALNHIRIMITGSVNEVIPGLYM